MSLPRCLHAILRKSFHLLRTEVKTARSSAASAITVDVVSREVDFVITGARR
jgi:hypothetical protein